MKLSWAVLIGLVVMCFDLQAAEWPRASEQRDPIAGAELAAELRSMVPSTNASWSGTMVRKLKDYSRERRPISCQIFVEPDYWSATYLARAAAGSPAEKLTVQRHADGRVEYFYWVATEGNSFEGGPRKLSGDDTMIRFAESDFYLSDFGMEFFHWPTQILLEGEMKRGQPCHVLDSISPRPDGNGYYRVRSWIEKEHLGLLQANAYDENGKLLKEFRTGSFQKDDAGNYQLKDMEITDRQAGTETQLRFDLAE